MPPIEDETTNNTPPVDTPVTPPAGDPPPAPAVTPPVETPPVTPPADKAAETPPVDKPAETPPVEEKPPVDPPKLSIEDVIKTFPADQQDKAREFAKRRNFDPDRKSVV